MNPDPKKSFWRDEMVSPFPVKYAKVKDKRGVEWELGYMDEYCGKQSNPPTLVLVHGKGAFGAHYGNMIKYAVERGFRVIAPDMPQWGTSGPGNIDKPMTRTLTDVRDSFHALVVGKLGVNKAYYYGHSLGGQTVLGYALRYPEAVQGLILEGPAGLEEYPKYFKMGDKQLPICDKSISYDLDRWHAAYDPLGLVDAELKRSPQEVRDFFYWKKRDAAGNAVPAPAGYFVNDTQYARLHTDQRVAMITGNRREFEQWAFMFVYDLFAICSENARDDENSLYKRLPQIKAPIFLAFGAIEPFIPSTALNGLTDKSKQVIIPFMERMKAAGNPPVVKIYPNVGHFIHTDVPLEFAQDTVSFMKTRHVDAVSPAVIDSLINGAANRLAAAAPAAGFRQTGWPCQVRCAMKTNMRKADVKKQIVVLGAGCCFRAAGRRTGGFDTSKFHAMTPNSGIDGVQDHLKTPLRDSGLPHRRQIQSRRRPGNLAQRRRGWNDARIARCAAPLKVAYIAVGTPKRNDRGEIINAVIVSTFYSGDSTNMYNTLVRRPTRRTRFSGGAVVGPGKADRYQPLLCGLPRCARPVGRPPSLPMAWGASSPPTATSTWCRANYRSAPRSSENRPGRGRHRGVSMGATQSWVWGVMHSPSGFVKAIMPIGGTTASDGDDPIGAWTFLLGAVGDRKRPQVAGDERKLLPLCRSTSIPSKRPAVHVVAPATDRLHLPGPLGDAVGARSSGRSFSGSRRVTRTAAWIARVKNEDPVDFWYRNDSGFNYNINKDLKRIKARTLVVHVDTDMWLIVENARNVSEGRRGGRVCQFPRSRLRTTPCSRRRMC